jgi:hypothetical protein
MQALWRNADMPEDGSRVLSLLSELLYFNWVELSVNLALASGHGSLLQSYRFSRNSLGNRRPILTRAVTAYRTMRQESSDDEIIALGFRLSACCYWFQDTFVHANHDHAVVQRHLHLLAGATTTG